MNENKGKIESLMKVMDKCLVRHQDKILNWWNDQVYDSCEKRLNELS